MAEEGHKRGGKLYDAIYDYADLDVQKLYDVINNQLIDIETFLHAVKTVVDAPEKFGLRIE